ncbi:MAG: hypothetical protein ACUVS4_16970 [Chloroflexaceae bacterium]
MGEDGSIVELSAEDWGAQVLAALRADGSVSPPPVVLSLPG